MLLLPLVLPDKKLALGSTCSQESAKAVHGEEKMKVVLMARTNALVTMPHEIKSNAFLCFLISHDLWLIKMFT